MFGNRTEAEPPTELFDLATEDRAAQEHGKGEQEVVAGQAVLPDTGGFFDTGTAGSGGCPKE